MDKKERVIATLKRCMDIQKTCGGCSYRKGHRGNGCMEKLFGEDGQTLEKMVENVEIAEGYAADCVARLFRAETGQE